MMPDTRERQAGPAERLMISDIAVRTGERTTVAEAYAAILPTELIDSLIEREVTHFSRIAGPILTAIGDCLPAPDRAGEIDAVILSTESFATFAGAAPATFREARDSIYDMVRSAGMGGAPVYCSTYGGCVNFVQSLLLARSFIFGGIHRNALLVAVEQAGDDGARLMLDAATLTGDGVAACRVGPARSATGDGFVVGRISFVSYGQKVLDGGRERDRLAILRSVRASVEDCLRKAGLAAEDVAWFVMGNYNRSTSLAFGKVSGFAERRIFLDGIGDFGHLPFDPLVNLDILDKSGRLAGGDRVLMLFCGPVSCAAMILEVVRADRS